MKDLWFSYAVGLLFNLVLNMLLIVIPLFAVSLGASALFVGLAVSLPAFAMLFLRIPGGIIADRVGSRRVARVALLSMIAAALVLSQATTTWLLLASQLLSGFARAVFWPALQSYVSRLPAYTLDQRMGYFTVATSVGGVAGPIIGGVGIATMGYSHTFLVLAGLAVFALAFTAGLAGTARPSTARFDLVELKRDATALLHNPNVYRTGLVTFMAALPLAMASSFYPVYVKWAGHPAEIVGTLSSFRTVTIGVGAFAFGLLTARLGKRGIFLTGAVAALVAYALTPAFRSFGSLAVAFTLIGLSQVLLNLTSLTMVGEWSAPSRRGLAMAVNGTFWSLSLLITPTALGLVTEWFSLELAFYGLAGLVLLLTVVGYRALADVMAVVARRPDQMVQNY